MKSVIELVVILVTTTVVVLGLKNSMKVARPANAKVSVKGYAFPSGHTAFSFALATFYAGLVIRLSVPFIETLLLILGVFTGAVFILAWRLQVRVHTVGQVIAGAGIGIAIALFVLFLL